MTIEDYDQIDPEEVELIDNRWCLASGIRRAQRFIKITGMQCLDGSNTKLGFDKSKVTCFRCKQKGHFKRECVNREVADHANPFHDDYYKKAIYHRNSDQSSKSDQKKIAEGSSKEKKQAMLTIHDGSSRPRAVHDDEGFDWTKYIPEDYKRALVAEVKERLKEEILKEKTYRDRCIVD
ncbi:putative transcription factor interactor and regulator CCHC(Zn) family [Helianthus annuus]|nr:putative transcription factor interactor and regulator CCHC(Zn) family [Helianthus annuus]